MNGTTEGPASFARWFNRELQRRGWTQTEFAERSGISKQRISEWSRGKRSPGSRSVKKIAAAFGMTNASIAVIAGTLIDEEEIDPFSSRARLLGMLQRVDLDDTSRVMVIERILSGYLDDDRAAGLDDEPGA